MSNMPKRTNETLDSRKASREKINHPPHYGGDTTYEVIKVIEAWGLGFCLGNAVKYIARAGLKTEDPTTDLQKAAWYIERAVQHEARRANQCEKS